MNHSILPPPTEREEAYVIRSADNRVRAVIRNAYAFQEHENLVNVRLEAKFDMGEEGCEWRIVPGTRTGLMKRPEAERVVREWMETPKWKDAITLAAREAERNWTQFLRLSVPAPAPSVPVPVSPPGFPVPVSAPIPISDGGHEAEERRTKLWRALVKTETALRDPAKRDRIRPPLGVVAVPLVWEGENPNVIGRTWHPVPAWDERMVLLWKEDECLRQDPTAPHFADAVREFAGAEVESLGQERVFDRIDNGDSGYDLYANGWVRGWSYEGDSLLRVLWSGA